MICPRCGTNLERGARFCGACGAKLLASGELAPQQPEMTGAKTLVTAEPVFAPDGRPAAGSQRGGASHTTVPAPGGVPTGGGPPPAAPARPVSSPAAAPARPAVAPSPAPARINTPVPSPRDPFL